MGGGATIGIDLGGTNTKGGVLDAAGRLTTRLSIATEAERGFEHVFERIVRLVRDLSGQSCGDAVGVGLAAPGPLSHATGVIHAAPNLPGWVNIRLAELLSAAVGLPVGLENDANAAAYGEHIAGAGVGCQNMVMLTLGTGVGGGVILGGQLVRGAFESAGEVGHMIVALDGRPCPCGQRGCLERYASAAAIAARARQRIDAGDETVLPEGRDLDAQDVAEAAGRGDALAREIWEDACRRLAQACVNLTHLINVERIVLGGGLSAAGEALLEPTRRHFEALFWRLTDERPQILTARLGDDAGVIGAAALARMPAA